MGPHARHQCRSTVPSELPCIGLPISHDEEDPGRVSLSFQYKLDGYKITA